MYYSLFVRAFNAPEDIYLNHHASYYRDKLAQLRSICLQMDSHSFKAQQIRISELRDSERYVRKMLKLCNLVPGAYQKSGLAYAISKKFVIRFAAYCAFAYGEQGIRVLSVSPGLIATDMGNLEAGEGGKLLKHSAEHRMGKPEELGYAIATLANEQNGYLAGVDILVDGGSTVGRKFRHAAETPSARQNDIPAAVIAQSAAH